MFRIYIPLFIISYLFSQIGLASRLSVESGVSSNKLSGASGINKRKSIPSQSPSELEGQHIINSIQDLFAALSQANHYFSYRSLLTYEANGYITTYKLNHWVKNSVAYEQLLFLDGPQREVFRQQSMLDCETRSNKQGIWPSASSRENFIAYTHKALGIERVANRKAVIFEIEPLDTLRYGYRYSVDQATGLLLKVITYEKKKIIERLQVVSLDFIDPQNAIVVDDESAYLWRVPEKEPCQAEQFQAGWQVGWVPEGFELVGTRLTAQGEQVLIFTDGLVSFSVFITQSAADGLSKVTARHGATVVVITPVESQLGRSVAVVGELPTHTARQIAVSVKPK